MPEGSEATIGFRTAGTWTGQDLVRFSTAVSGIYNAFLVARVRDRLQANYIESLEVAFQRYEKFLGHPFYHEMFHLWRDALRSYRKLGSDAAPPFLFPLLPFGFQDPSATLPSDQEIYSNLERYSTDEEKCYVHSIRVASPGGFSFEGIGQLIEQFRELLKDLWWRNRAERARDQLEIIERYLRLRRENPDVDLPLPPYLRKDAYLVTAVHGHVAELKLLEDRGKLEAVPQHLDYVPE
jgi:hypothetical protein